MKAQEAGHPGCGVPPDLQALHAGAKVLLWQAKLPGDRLSHATAQRATATHSSGFECYAAGQGTSFA